MGADIFGEAWGKQWKSLSVVLLLVGFGLAVASDYDGAFNRSGSILMSQAIYDGIGIILALSLFFAPHAGRWDDVWRWTSRGFFALGIVFLMVPLSPWYCDVNSQRWWIQLWGFRINLCLWSGIFILPVIIRILARPFTKKRALLLIALLSLGKMSINATRLSSAWLWLPGVIALLVLATLSPTFRGVNTWPRRDRVFRICLVAALAITVVSPMAGLIYDPGACRRLITWCVETWMPERMKNYTYMYQIWTIHHNFVKGGLAGSSDLLTIRQCVGYKSAISEFVLQMVAFRFGLIGVGLVLAASFWLARLWIRHALCAPTLELRLWRLGLSLLLVFHMFASVTRTTGLIPFMPAAPYPFLAYGANITLWSFVCLGLLLQRNNTPLGMFSATQPPGEGPVNALRKNLADVFKQASVTETRAGAIQPDELSLWFVSLREKVSNVIRFGEAETASAASAREGAWLCADEELGCGNQVNAWKERDEKLCTAVADCINASLLNRSDIGFDEDRDVDRPRRRRRPARVWTFTANIEYVLGLDKARCPGGNIQGNIEITIKTALERIQVLLNDLEVEVRAYLDLKARRQPESLSLRGEWLLADNSHDGVCIRRTAGNQVTLEAWAENWEHDLWNWKTGLTPDEVAHLLAAPNEALTRARKILRSSREWLITPPSSVPQRPYIKQGTLNDWDDGFRDEGTGVGHR